MCELSPVAALGYVGLHVTDVGAWTRLATDVLGLSARHGTQGGARLRCDARTYRIQLFHSSGDGLAHAGLEMPDERALASAVARLEACGHVVKTDDDRLARDRGVAVLASVDDPDGNHLELYVGQFDDDTPFVSPTGARFVTSGSGFGQLSLAVRDLEAARRFYVDTLGFRITSRVCREGGHEELFLGCNRRHHGFRLVPVLDEVPGLLDLTLEVTDLDVVGRAYENCRAGAGAVSRTLGRHSYDHMLSFYLRTPSGFEVQFGTGAVTVGRDWTESRYDVASSWGHTRTPACASGAEHGWWQY